MKRNKKREQGNKYQKLASIKINKSLGKLK